MLSKTSFTRRNVLRWIGSILAASLIVPSGFGAGVTIRFASDSSGTGGAFIKALCDEWSQKTGNKVEIISRPQDASATLQQYQQYWAAKSGDVDVYQIDVIWQSIAAPHSVDLKKYFKPDEISQHFPRIIENNTRMPNELLGDISAQLAPVMSCAQRP